MKDITKPIQAGNLLLRNGFIRSATNEGYAQDDGSPSEKHITYYEQLAKGGVSLIITGFCYCSQEGKVTDHMLGFYKEEQIPYYKQLTTHVHTFGSKILLQLVHGDHLKQKSPMNYSIDEIKIIVEEFARTAQLAEKANFDGIQIHGAHGYLLSQFLNRNSNQRFDIYGGNLQNRSRILFDIVHCIRSKVSEHFHISIKLHCSDFHPLGLRLEESMKIAKALQDDGLNSVEISGGDYRQRKDECFYVNEAEQFAQHLQIPVFVVGGNRNLKTLAELYQTTSISGFSMCRALINNPYIVQNYIEYGEAISNCIGCSQCFSKSTPCILSHKTIPNT